MSVGQYQAIDIEILEGLEAVRLRPAMYIGGVDSRGVHHCLWEIVDNAIDEYLNGHADRLEIVLHADNRSVTVVDNGRGIPVDIHPKAKKPALEVVFTQLHAGGKFSKKNYTHSGGLHGVGASVVNALAKELIVTVRRDGHEYRQTFQRGKPVTAVKKLGTARGHGTSVTFRLDETIFPRPSFHSETVKAHLEDISFLHNKLRILFTDEAKGETVEFSQPGGLPAYLERMLKESQKSPVAENGIFHFVRETGDRLETVFLWTNGNDEQIRSYVNGIRTHAGGTHETGLRNALNKAIRGYLDTHKIPIKGVTITADDIREGLVAILSLFHQDPQFQGQTKERLNNSDATANVEAALRPALENWLNGNPTLADRIIGRIILAARAREASRDAALEIKRKSPTSRKLNLPGKLTDCTSNQREETEIFIVEGDSAGGSARMGRNSKFQAVLPLRGKVLNSEGMITAKALKNTELSDLVQALGCGIGTSFQLANLRYGKIILLMDADSDGHHISTLLLTFFYRHLPDIIRAGKLYIARPPLYRIKVGKNDNYWAFDDLDKEKILEKLPKNAKPQITRFKGLGEMQPITLAETTLRPESRILLQVKIDSELDADRTFVTLLGKDASLRYQFIMESTSLADELDF